LPVLVQLSVAVTSPVPVRWQKLSVAGCINIAARVESRASWRAELSRCRERSIFHFYWSSQRARTPTEGTADER
jgi:hypothetical protein